MSSSSRLTNFRHRFVNAMKAHAATGIATAAAPIRDKVVLGSELAAARNKIRDLETHLARLQVELRDATARAAAFESERTRVAALFGITAIELTAASPGSLKAHIDRKIGDLALEQVACLGFPASKLPAQIEFEAPGSASALFAQYAEISDPIRRAAFYAANIAPKAPLPILPGA